MALYSNIHRKPRRLKGTSLFTFRYYIFGGTMAFAGLSFIAFYNLNKELTEKCCERPEDVMYRNVFTQSPSKVFVKTSEELKKEMLELEKREATTLF